MDENNETRRHLKSLGPVVIKSNRALMLMVSFVA